MKMTFTNALSTRMIRQQMIDEKKQELTSKETRGRLLGGELLVLATASSIQIFKVSKASSLSFHEVS